jgi:hypothetical protein
MTFQDIAQMIESMGLPYTYDTFPNNAAPLPPYIVFNYPDRNDFGADDINYSKIGILNLELYTASKDFNLEKTVEDILAENGFYYEKSEAFINKEQLFQITYVMQFVIKE